LRSRRPSCECHGAFIQSDRIALQRLPSESHGKDAVGHKNIWWFDTNEVHSASVNGPFVGPERIAVVFSFGWTVKASGERRQFSEVAIYTVVNGKIIREEFPLCRRGVASGRRELVRTPEV